ncbi:hypothetical protein ACU3L3_07120 [Priestia endophytica]
MSVEHGIEVLRRERNSIEYVLKSHCWDSETEKEMKDQLEQIELSIKLLGGDKE